MRVFQAQKIKKTPTNWKEGPSLTQSSLITRSPGRQAAKADDGGAGGREYCNTLYRQLAGMRSITSHFAPDA